MLLNTGSGNVNGVYCPNIEIAKRRLFYTLGKLGLASRTQAALWAVDHKLAGPRG